MQGVIAGRNDQQPEALLSLQCVNMASDDP